MVEELVAPGDSVGDAVRLLRTLSDSTRLRLLGVLQGGEHNVTDLCRHLGLPQPTISHHLGLLRTAGLVANRRDGKQVYYSLNGSTVSRLGRDGGLAIVTGPLQLEIRGSTPNGAVVV
jgi:DNA-binding transcriptional ArsR family regulator